MNKLTIVLALAIATSGAVQADTEVPAPGDDSFNALDRNSDGRISRSEAGFDRVLSMIFADIDSDGDGFVTPLEYAAAEQSHSLASKR